MDLMIYKNYITIVDEGSLTKATEKLHIEQSTLSQQIKRLQTEYGAPLLKMHQGKRQIELTDMGRILYERAKILVALLETTEFDIKEMQQGLQGTLRLSMSPSVSMEIIRSKLCEFMANHPKVTYDIYEVGIEEQEEQLLNGVAEIGIANAPLLHPEKFKVYHTQATPMAAVVHRDSPYIEDVKRLRDNWQSKRNVRRFSKIPVFITRGCIQTFMSFFSATELTPKIMAINTTRTATLQWAIHNKGVALVPMEKMDCPSSTTLKTFWFPENAVANYKSYYVVKDRPLSALGKQFLDMLV